MRKTTAIILFLLLLTNAAFGEATFSSYGNSSALLICENGKATLTEVEVFPRGFATYEFEDLVEIKHFGLLFFTYEDSNGDGNLWFFKGNHKSIPFDENDYEEVLYWQLGIIIKIDGAYHEIDTVTTYSTSTLTIKDETLSLEKVSELVNLQ